MDRLKALLDIQSIVSSTDIDGRLKEIAETLMNEYCIFNGQHLYRPIEIEFYIYDKEAHADEHVYQRDAEAGRVFFHKSGMDICFASSMKDGRFGGILIRALEREDGKCFGGPRICSYEVLNTASDICTVDPCEEKCSYSTIASERIGISEWHDAKSDWKDEYFNKKYRFVREGLETIVMEFDSFDFRETAYVQNKKSYKF